MDPLPPRAQLIEQVYRRLLDAICSRRLAPGTRIPQEQLADRLEVSRQPVSHALQLLKQQGFVRDAGRRGLVVAPIDADYLRAVYDVRAALDAVAAAEAAQRLAAIDRSDDPEATDLLARADTSLEHGRAALAAGDRIAMAEADVDFHGAINALSGNPVIVEIARQQWGHIRRAIDAVLDDRELHRRIWNEHAAILAAIVAGDAALAEMLARDHARRVGRETWQRLTGRPCDAAGREGAAA